MNRDHKLLLETWQTKLSGFIGFGGSQGHRWLWRGHPSLGHVVSDQEGEQDP
jgi:hypothetical protein